MEPSGLARGNGDGGSCRRLSLLLATVAVIAVTCLAFPSFAVADPADVQGVENGLATAPGQRDDGRGRGSEDDSREPGPAAVPPSIDEPAAGTADGGVTAENEPVVAPGNETPTPGDELGVPLVAEADGEMAAAPTDEQVVAADEVAPPRVDQSVLVDQSAIAVSEAKQVSRGKASGSGVEKGANNGTDNGGDNKGDNKGENKSDDEAGNGDSNTVEIPRERVSGSGDTDETGNGTEAEKGQGRGNAYGRGNGSGNAYVAVRVNESGDAGSILQQNDATAAATATVETVVESDEPTETIQTAVADAQASQTGLGNVVVSVRVGSPGDDGSVTQVNAAAAEAVAATATTSADVEMGAVATAEAVQESVSNTTVSVRVFSPGDDGGITQINEAAATATTAGVDGGPSAIATQDDVSNTNVTIRVESPGASGPVEQRSEAIETAAIGQGAGAEQAPSSTGTAAVSVTTIGSDTSVTVNVQGEQLARPGRDEEDELLVWEWVWSWDYAEEVDGPVATSADADSWIWDWATGDVPGGTVTTRAGTEAERPGTWVWAWGWERQVQDWAWSWFWGSALECDSCAWVWNWTWDWTGQPGAVVETDASATPADGVMGSEFPVTADVVQRNGAVAEAVASAVAEVTQIAEQEGALLADGFIGQLVDVVQTANATATTSQELGPMPVDGAREAIVTSSARTEMIAAVVQSAAQEVVGVPESAVAQWIGQQTGILQDASSTATGNQGGVAGGAGSAAATAQAVSVVDQEAVQRALVEAGETTQWIGQLTLVDQLLDATATTTQAAVEDAIVVPAQNDDPRASSVALASDFSLVTQMSVQHASRAEGLGEQTVVQTILVTQVATAAAATGQLVGTSVETIATSQAVASNRSLVEQLVEQAQFGLGLVEIQDSTQQALVEQFATATSTSAGGVAGSALVVNCSTVQQGAGQWIGVASPDAGLADRTPFCAPLASTGTRNGSAPTPSPSGSTVPSVATVSPAVPENDPPPMRGSRFIPSADVSPSGKTRGATAPFAPPVAPSFGTSSPQQVSAPPTPQARFDTRPGGSAGPEDTGREPPLPPVGGSPGWAAALAAAASAAGSSGIAAILFALALMPPLGLRVRNGSVVRRPTSVLSWVDVPI